MSRLARWIRDSHRESFFAQLEFKLMVISDFDPSYIPILAETIQVSWGRAGPQVERGSELILCATGALRTRRALDGSSETRADCYRRVTPAQETRR